MFEIRLRIFRLFLRFMNNTHKPGRTALYDWPARRRDRSLKKNYFSRIGARDLSRKDGALNRTAPGIDLPHKYSSFLIDLFISRVLAPRYSSLCWHTVAVTCVGTPWEWRALAPCDSSLCWHPVAVICIDTLWQCAAVLTVWRNTLFFQDMGIESRWVPPSLLYNGVPSLFPVGEAAESGNFSTPF